MGYGDPEKAIPADLRRRRDELELQVLRLRDARAKISEDEYYRRIDPLLLEIARVYQKVERRWGGGVILARITGRMATSAARTRDTILEAPARVPGYVTTATGA